MKRHLSDWRVYLLAVAIVTLIGITVALRTLAQGRSAFEYNGITVPAQWRERSEPDHYYPIQRIYGQRRINGSRPARRGHGHL